MFEFLKLLAVAHEAQPEERLIEGEKHIFYNGPSPDEITLVDFAKNNGLVVSSVSDNDCIVRVYPESGLVNKQMENYNSGHKGDSDVEPEDSNEEKKMMEREASVKKLGFEVIEFTVHK